MTRGPRQLRRSDPERLLLVLPLPHRHAPDLVRRTLSIGSDPVDPRREKINRLLALLSQRVTPEAAQA
jgi:hypothetical protein